MDVYSFFSEMGEVETEYGHWLLGAVGAGGQKTDIIWDQYLEVRASEHYLLMIVPEAYKAQINPKVNR